MTFDPAAGTYQDSVDVALSSATPGATIYYTTDGTTPTTASSVYSAPVNLTASATVQAFATYPDYHDSAVTSAAYTIDTTPPPPTVPGAIADAPSLEETVIYNVATSTSFLYTGPDAVQTGMDPATIEPVRAAVVRGQVFTRDGDPLAGATVTILDHPEYGQTISRSDGFFDLAINGGGYMTVNYQLSGYLPAQRKVQVPWQDYAITDDVALVPLDTQVTTIDLAAITDITSAQGTVQTDSDGTRQATLLFSPGTTAELVFADGTTQAISSLNVRATEYTVGPNGPTAMPAELPSASAYTYGSEFSVDEAVALGAVGVQFDQDVAGYLENFLNVPVGTNISSGVFDRGGGVWKAQANGLAVKIVSITGGLADLDTDGDDVADDAATLAALGITDGERAKLATLYTAGQTLWRMSLGTLSFNAFGFGFGY